MNAPQTQDELFERVKKLSPREMEVLRCLARQYRVKEIAIALNIRENTVWSYVREAKMKLHANSNREMAELIRQFDAWQAPHKNQSPQFLRVEERTFHDAEWSHEDARPAEEARPYHPMGGPGTRLGDDGDAGKDTSDPENIGHGLSGEYRGISRPGPIRPGGGIVMVDRRKHLYEWLGRLSLIQLAGLVGLVMLAMIAFVAVSLIALLGVFQIIQQISGQPG